jgi:hypothetical protein
MHLLFVHQNFPGQYRHLAAHFARNREHSVAAIGEARSLTSWEDETRAIRCFPYTMPPLAPSPVHRYLRGSEIAAQRAKQVRDVAITLKRQGFIPDIICAHTGWGEALLLKDVFPDSPILGFFLAVRSVSAMLSGAHFDHLRRYRYEYADSQFANTYASE